MFSLKCNVNRSQVQIFDSECLGILRIDELFHKKINRAQLPYPILLSIAEYVHTRGNSIKKYYFKFAFFLNTAY